MQCSFVAVDSNRLAFSNLFSCSDQFVSNMYADLEMKQQKSGGKAKHFKYWDFCLPLLLGPLFLAMMTTQGAE